LAEKRRLKTDNGASLPHLSYWLSYAVPAVCIFVVGFGRVLFVVIVFVGILRTDEIRSNVETSSHDAIVDATQQQVDVLVHDARLVRSASTQ
jgi:hypothetical protein